MLSILESINLNELTLEHKLILFAALSVATFAVLSYIAVALNSQRLRQQQYDEAAAYISEVETAAHRKLDAEMSNHILLREDGRMRQLIDVIKQRHACLQARWDKMNWGNRLFNDHIFLQLESIQQKISYYEAKRSEYLLMHSSALDALHSAYQKKKKTVSERLDLSYQYWLEAINAKPNDKIAKDARMQFALFGGLLGAVPSLANDFYLSQQVYDALRSVNGNFVEMTDAEIWWECLWMNDASLAGLTSLTKGAYFEMLVEESTGGELHEYFNHPDTDITIAGDEFQLKATDSIEYVNSVDEGIPIIATSEVAEFTDVIDSGFTNEEITEQTETALGGDVFDVGDGLADGVLGSLGGLGVFSTLQGFNHATKTYEETNDAPKAIEEGAGIAVVGTVKGLANLAELVFKLLTSRPIVWVVKTGYKAFASIFRRFV